VISSDAPINVLLVKLGTEPGLEEIPLRLRKIDARIRTFGVLSTPNQEHAFDEVISSSFEAMLGAQVEYLRDGLYVRPELFAKLRNVEGQILRMYDRVAISDFSKFARTQVPIPEYVDSVDDRVQLFLRHAAYWDNALRKHDIKAVVAQNYGHNGYDAVLQAVAIANDIPYMFFHEFRPFQRSQQMYESVGDLASDDLSRTLIDIAREKFPYIDDSIGRRSDMMRQVGLLESASSSTTTSPGKSSRSMVSRVRTVLGPRDRLVKAVCRRIRNRKSMLDEARACSRERLPAKYLFCELQSQPNATTALKGWMFPDQRESLAMIAHHLPAGWNLVVKESDRQWTRMYPRRRSFWSHISAIPRVHVVNSTSDAISLLKGSGGLVETSYSTLALRAVQEGIQVIVLGHTHIGSLAGVHCVTTDVEAQEAVAEICSSNHSRLDPSQINASLQSFIDRKIECSIEGTLSYVPKSLAGDERSKFIERTVTNVSSVIVAWLQLKLKVESRP
jgi:hypothetical protein